MKVLVATCVSLPEVDVDEAPLMAALAAAGYDAQLAAWDDPSVTWDAPVLLRSTWNYALNPGEFLAWVDRLAVVWNPREIVRWNVSKSYLGQLQSRGVHTVPTVYVPRGGTATISERSVVKPEIGAGSLDTRVFEPGDPDLAAHLAQIHRRCNAMIQPYVASIHDYGERSLVWIDGEFTHAIRKTPRFSGDAEKVEGPVPIADDERALATAALAPYAHQILYGRVDLARDTDGRPMVMELELVEPSLFFARHPPALDRYIAGLDRVLRFRRG